jgi:small basic protein (TIGR04137 family)
MTIDKSLRVKAGMNKVRNVLKRGERLERLKEADRFGADSSPLGLPKVRVFKLSLKKKKKVKKEDEAATPAAGKKAAKAAPKK